MQPRNYWGWAVALLLVGTGWALVQLFDVSTRGGEIYPPYSSLRSDPMGTKVLHDSLAALPGYRVDRWFEPLRRFHPRDGDVVLMLGARKSTDLLADCAQWARAGARVVVAFATGELAPKEEGWILVPDAEWLSNEGLQKARQSQRLLDLLGGRRHVIFEESHLGVVQQGSVGQLLRRYRLWGAALVLLVLAALFFWRSTSSLLPAETTTSQEAAAPDEDALVSLVRGAVPAGSLATSARALWTRGGVLRGVSEVRRVRVTLVLSEPAGSPLAAWNRAHEILKRQKP
jgi:hypothetical protein